MVTIADTTGTGAAASATFNITTVTGGLPKFVDKLPGLGPSGANGVIQAHGAGQYIPVGVPETCTYSGQAADCYSIALVEYSEKLSSNLPPTRLRGYVQLSTTGTIRCTIQDGTHDPDASTGMKFAVDNPHYLGPVLVAKGRVAGIANTLPTDPGYPKPVRITFYNLLPPTSAGGNLFLPVDETVPGSGVGPALPATDRREVPAEPGHGPPPRQQHRVDQRRQHAPVDHAGKLKTPPTRPASARGTCRTWAPGAMLWPEPACLASRDAGRAAGA